jgi:cephalosporin-C deacetylase-like acetyl esterase
MVVSTEVVLDMILALVDDVVDPSCMFTFAEQVHITDSFFI